MHVTICSNSALIASYSPRHLVPCAGPLLLGSIAAIPEPQNCVQMRIPPPEHPDEAAADLHKRTGDEAFVRQAFAEVWPAWTVPHPPCSVVDLLQHRLLRAQQRHLTTSDFRSSGLP